MTSNKLNERELRVDRAFAQGDIVYQKKEVVRVVNGERISTQMNVNSPNQERINDAVTMHFQHGARSVVDYKNLEQMALEQLEPLFVKHGLNSVVLEDEPKRLKTAIIRQTIDQYVLDTFDDPKIEIGYNELVELSGIKSSRNFAATISTIMSIKGKSSKDFRRDIVNLDSMTIESTEYRSIAEISEVTIVLDPDMGKHYPVIEDFLNAKTMPDGRLFRNKKKYIRKIIFTFSKSALPHIVAQGENYVALVPGRRQGYELQNTYHIDTYVTSIQKAQDYEGLTDFTPDRLQKKFGHAYDDFYEYLRNVIDPSIEDFNNNNKRHLSYLIQRGTKAWREPKDTRRGASQITRFRWVITNYEDTARSGINPIVYYIALQILEQDEVAQASGLTVEEMSKDVSAQLETELPDITVISGKTVAIWLKEAAAELEFEEKIVQLLRISDVKDMLYDEELMRIVSSKVDLGQIKRPSESYEYLTTVLKVNTEGTKKKRSKSALFPSGDESFIQKVFESATASKYNSPIHFFFSMRNHYSANKIKKADWNSVVNSWMMNGKYDHEKERNMELVLTVSGGDGESQQKIGHWDHKNSTFETDLEIIPLNLETMAEQIASGNVKIYGAL